MIWLKRRKCDQKWEKQKQKNDKNVPEIHVKQNKKKYLHRSRKEKEKQKRRKFDKNWKNKKYWKRLKLLGKEGRRRKNKLQIAINKWTL